MGHVTTSVSSSHYLPSDDGLPINPNSTSEQEIGDTEQE